MSPHAHKPAPAIAFVGYVASHQRVVDDPTLSLADNRMQRGYAVALGEQYDDVQIFSTVPAHPGQGAEALDSDDDGLRVRHLGTASGRSRVLRKPLALARELDRWVREHDDRPTILVHYNTFLLYTAVAWWLRRRHGTRIVPIAITMPYGGPDSPQSLAARVQDLASRRLLRRVDGIIAITPFLGRELAPGVPSLVVRGAVADDALTRADTDTATVRDRAPRPDGQRLTRIVYAGNLTLRYNLAAAIAMMEHLPVDRFVLDVYGRGALEAPVQAAAESIPHVRFHGAVAESAVPPLLREADLLLALLTPDDELARFTFPSKLFESLASGTPVLTTDLPTLNEEMRDHLVVVTDLDPEHLASVVTRVCGRSPEEKQAAATGALEFLRQHATWSAVGRRLHAFFDCLEAPAHD